jgi:ABC-type antimicrobial peptide transport system permease subunit
MEKLYVVSMSLNLNDKLPSTGGAYYTSTSYTDAVNDAQIVRTFSFIALAGSVLIFIGGFIAVAVGIAVMAFGARRYYRLLGLAVVLLSLGSFGLPVLRILASLVLCVGVAWRAMQILSTLAAEGKGDPDWLSTRNRARLALVLSCVGLLTSAIWLLLFILGSFLRSH